MSSPPPTPLPNSYWVLPGQLLAGEHPTAPDVEGAGERIARLLGAGIDFFVNLTAPEELPAYEDALPAGVLHHRRPIRDHDVPSGPEPMIEILALIQDALRSGRRVYVHCRAGVGRTGTVIGCLLVQRGLSGDAALDELNRVWQQCARAAIWPSVPETEDQIRYVRAWLPGVSLGGGGVGAAERVAGAPAGTAALHARFLGALLGLATADALAAPTEQHEPGSFAPVTGFTGGGRFDLPPGAWTDDTAMALCLADSLLACGGFDARDQIDRYLRWWQEGYLSATGECVGLREPVTRALAAAQWRRQLFPGSHEPRQQDPEPLSRIAPVAMFAFSSLEETLRLAADATRITCQAAAVVEVCRVFAAMLHLALAGGAKEEILAPPQLQAGAVRPRVRSLLLGRYRGKQSRQVRTGSTAVEALEAALWAFDRTSTFEDGALLVANLGGNSDVAGAAYGQIAGAYYTAAGIPAEWRIALSRLELLESLADQLFRVSQRLD